MNLIFYNRAMTGKIPHCNVPRFWELSFYFLIFSNTNIIDRKIYKITLNDTRIEEHINFLYKIKKIKADAEQNGWKAYPDPKNCSNCPVSKDCLHFTNIPQIKEIYY